MTSAAGSSFDEGASYLLETWPALHVAFGYAGGDGAFIQSSHIATNFYHEILDYFHQYGDAILPEDMIQFFDDFLEDVLETAVDDQSVEEVTFSCYFKQL